MDSATTTTRPVYRIATLSDLDQVASIETERFGEHAYPYFVLRQLFDLHGTNWLVAEADGRVFGYALVARAPRRCAWLLSLAVSIDSCGRGHGTTLLERALQLCDDLRMRAVRITVRPTNEAAYRIYNRAGFTRTHHEERYFGEGEPRDVLECALDRRPRAPLPR